MSVKQMQVFECDLEGCGKLAPFGKLPDDWVWYLHKYNVQAVGPDGRPTGKPIEKSAEHEFCSEKHKDAWLKSV